MENNNFFNLFKEFNDNGYEIKFTITDNLKGTNNRIPENKIEIYKKNLNFLIDNNIKFRELMIYGKQDLLKLKTLINDKEIKFIKKAEPSENENNNFTIDEYEYLYNLVFDNFNSYEELFKQSYLFKKIDLLMFQLFAYKKEREVSTCKPFVCELGITPENKIIPCSRLLSKQNNFIDLYSNTIKEDLEYYQSNKEEDFNSDLEKCSECIFYSICGNCKVLAEEYSYSTDKGFLHTTKKCNELKKELTGFLKAYKKFKERVKDEEKN